MSNFRVAFIISGGVFFVSFVTGLLGGAVFLTALLRALVFAVVFFGIVAGIYCLYNKFLLPDESSGGGPPALGRNVDYTVDDGYDWLSTQEGADENLTPASGTDSVTGQPEGEESGDAAEPFGLPADEDRRALEQSRDNIYTDNKAPVPEKPSAGSAGSDGYAFDIDMSGFMPDAPMFNVGRDGGKAVPSGAPEWQAEAGVVDMSVARRPDAKADLYSGIDGKKMAGAIKTLLKKDEG
jgi:hypothetical protein